MGDLIPGLPDAVALECIVRLPYDCSPTARSVSRLWREEVESPRFHHLRKSARLTRPLLVLAQAEPGPPPTTTRAQLRGYRFPSAPVYRLVLLDPGTATWTALPPISGRPRGLPLFPRLAAVGRELVVVGGWDPTTWAASDEVHVYDFVAAAWRSGARMPGPRRSFFACAGSEADGAVFVAGGHDEDKNALRSALAYDVAKDEWVPLPDMARERDECHGVLLRGVFHVIGGYATEGQGKFSGSAEAFDVATWRWRPVREGFRRESPRACVVVAGGKLYTSLGGQVAVQQGDTWRMLAAMPGDVRAALHLEAWDDKLVVVGLGHHGGTRLVYVLEFSEGRKLLWKKVEVPTEYSGNVQAVCRLEI